MASNISEKEFIYEISVEVVYYTLDFGKGHLREIIRTHAAEPAKAIQDAVLQAVADHRGDRPQEDDVTLVIVKAVL